MNFRRDFPLETSCVRSLGHCFYQRLATRSWSRRKIQLLVKLSYIMVIQSLCGWDIPDLVSQDAASLTFEDALKVYKPEEAKR